MSAGYEYRLSWEVGDAITPAVVEKVCSPREDRWQTLTDEEWDGLVWRSVTRTDREPPSQQVNTLREWARTHYQAIRNVRLERRPARDDNDGWEMVG